MSFSEAVITANNLSKKYNEFTAVNNINFNINKGICVGFLGPNGAGKTTTVKMICCFSPVTSGDLHVFNMDVRYNPRKIKENLGIVPQENNLDIDLTVEENLIVYASYFDIPRKIARERTHNLLSFFELIEHIETRVDKLSGGMKRKLIIARALINNPGLLILDEPTTGLDPGARHLVWERLHKLKKSGITLLLTTHYLEDADRLCDYLLIMDQGKILEKGAPQELVNKHIGEEVLELGIYDNQKEYILKQTEDQIHGYLELGNKLYLFPYKGQKLLEFIQTKDINSYHQFLRQANLEDVFFKLTGRELGE